MNTKGIFSGMTFVAVALTATLADDNSQTAKPATVSKVKAAVVSEVRSQDSAYAMLAETYRQIQVLMIESDYEKRVTLAKSITNPQEQTRCLAMVTQERDLRLAKLQTTLAGMTAAYTTSRKELEHKAGGTIVANVSAEETSDQIRHLKPFTPAEFRMENRQSDLLPAVARMLYDDHRR